MISGFGIVLTCPRVSSQMAGSSVHVPENRARHAATQYNMYSEAMDGLLRHSLDPGSLKLHELCGLRSRALQSLWAIGSQAMGLGFRVEG